MIHYKPMETRQVPYIFFLVKPILHLTNMLYRIQTLLHFLTPTPCVHLPTIVSSPPTTSGLLSFSQADHFYLYSIRLIPHCSFSTRLGLRPKTQDMNQQIMKTATRLWFSVETLCLSLSADHIAKRLHAVHTQLQILTAASNCQGSCT